MYTDRNALIEFAYKGVFYKKVDSLSPDGDLIDGDTDGTEEVLLETDCDIQETNKLFSSGTITLGYTVYFPLDINEGLAKDLKAGAYFRSDMYGMGVGGMVIGLYPSQMGGCVAYIKGSDI